ncbi:MAG TPA: hypothetical protein PLP50_13610 [Thermoanaerobaculia bacterium]|nr:hypothetical protein [Thermoanaerobaculia bacterium]HQN08630.1 hypothetical protein [Thermoanaerobaculia bacterium]
MSPTVVAGGGGDHLVGWAGDCHLPGTPSLAFAPGRARENHGVIELIRDGTRTHRVKSTAASSVDDILDVTGHFE